MDFEQACSRKKEFYLKKIIKISLKKIRKHSPKLHQIIKICHDDILQYCRPLNIRGRPWESCAYS